MPNTQQLIGSHNPEGVHVTPDDDIFAVLQDAEVELKIVRSRRRSTSMRVISPAVVEVRAPLHLSEAKINEFIRTHKRWLKKQLAYAEKQNVLLSDLEPFSDAELAGLKARAKPIILERVAFFANVVGVDYGRVTIRAQTSRWGSCNSRGNLNFNCLLTLTPPEVLDYVVVHELCHRLQMNHSAAFWAEVERVLPDYRDRRRWLKENGGVLLARLKVS